jgi:hypothetical protein
MRILFSPASSPTFVVGGDVLTEVRWNLSVVLICISFMARDGEHFFHVFFSQLDFFISKSPVHFICPFLY